jgi:hypothetical protein
MCVDIRFSAMNLSDVHAWTGSSPGAFVTDRHTVT